MEGIEAVVVRQVRPDLFDPDPGLQGVVPRLPQSTWKEDRMDEARRSLRTRRAIAAAALIAIPAACVVATATSTAAHQSTTTTSTSTTVASIPTPTIVTTTQPSLPVVSVTSQPSPPAPVVAGCFADLAAQAGWPVEAIPHLTVIIERESHCDPSSNTGYRPSTGDWSLGLLQINTLGDLLAARQATCAITSREQLLDPATNLRCGLAIYNISGFGPWGG